jgi:hypothetical protein
MSTIADKKRKYAEALATIAALRDIRIDPSVGGIRQQRRTEDMSDNQMDCCIDCDTNTREIKEPIIALIKQEIRNKLGLPPGKHTPLCMDCLEKRIGRELRPSDIEATFNWWITDRASERLRNRLGKLIDVRIPTKRSGYGRQ